MNVLVTGGTGFVGLNLIPVLRRKGHRVRVVVRDRSPTDRLPERVETVEADLRQPETLADSLDWCDAVIHLAQLSPADGAAPPELVSANVRATESLFELSVAHDVSPFVFTSTIYAHPEIPSPPPSAYERSKRRAEEAIADRGSESRLAIVYPTFIFGPRDYRLSRFEYFRRVQSNPVLVPPLYPSTRFNVVHVRDVARSIAHCLADGTDTRHVVSGPNVSSVQLHRKIAKTVAGKHVVVPVPEFAYRRLVGPLVDRLYCRGLSPIPGDRFRETAYTGAVPPRYANRAPVRQSPVDRTLRDAHAWYEEVGLL